MASVARENGEPFCIDTYEWPNLVGQKPLASMSWVQAKISCLDAGKRLCTREEWVAACRTSRKTAYPYGQKYEKGKCPTEGKGAYKSGAFPLCGENGGARDMVGNVWEWVEDKRGDYPLMLGGSSGFGAAADCYLTSEGGVGLKNGEVGFRCCK
jgi:formylglycine-generating enzyme required for sulfatase activity